MSRRRLTSQQHVKETNTSEMRTRNREINSLSQPHERSSRHSTLSQPDQKRKRNQRNILSQPEPSTSYADDAEDIYSSQMSQVDISAQEERVLAINVINYLFVMDKTKRATLRVNIIKNALNGEGKKFRPVIKHAQDLLSQIFGYRLEKIENDKYFLVNEIENDFLKNSLSDNEKAQQILLFIILAHIFMSDGSSTEETICHFLEELEIIQGDNFYNEYFGDVKQLMTVQFVTQMYLEKHNPKDQSEKVSYSWGERSRAEIRPRKVLEFVSQVYGGQPLETWPRQLKTVRLSET